MLGNDTDETPATLTAVLQAATTKGTLTLNANGSFTYNYTGGAAPDTDSFTYKARDASGQLSNTATVTINVAQGGTTGGAPVGRGDTYATPVNTPLSVTAYRLAGVLYNDFDTDASGNNIGNAGLTAQLVSGPTNGTLHLQSGRLVQLHAERDSERQRQRQLHLPGHRCGRQPVGRHHGEHQHPVEAAGLQDHDELRAGHALHRLRVRLLLRPAALQLHPGAGGQTADPG